MQIQTLDQLMDVDSPAWPEVLSLIRDARNPADIVPRDEASSRSALYRLQVTAASTLGAVALNCGGILVDAGWVRHLGGGSGRLPSLADANNLGDPMEAQAAPPALVVAFDVLGGRFAINGGALDAGRGEVCYFGPDALAWTGLGAGHSAFVAWLLSGDLDAFYGTLRWPGWKSEIAGLPLDEGISVYPPPFTKEGKDLSQASRRPVPMRELLELYAG